MLQDIQHILVVNQRVLMLVAICIIVDTMTGISKAITNEEFSVQSKLMRKVFTKLLQYSGVLILFAGIELTFDIPCLVIACITEIIIEIKSVSENVKAIPQLSALIENVTKNIKK